MRNGRVLIAGVVILELVVIALLAAGKFSGGPAHQVQIVKGAFDRNPSIDLDEIDSETYLMAAVGDSHTAGAFPDRTKAWPSVLEKELENRSDREYRVINYGDSGSGIRMKVEHYSRIRINPDMLLFQIGRDDTINSFKFRRKVREFLRRENVSHMSPEALRYKSELRASMLRDSMYDAREIYREGFQQLEDEVSEDTEVVVIHFRPPTRRIEWTREMVEGHGWDYLLWDDFYREQESNESELYISPNDHHYNHRGNRIWAEELAEYLRSNYSLGEDGPL